MQNWSSKVWIKSNKEQVMVEDMSLLEVLQAIWAMHILTIKNPKFLGVPYSVLGKAIYSRMRTLQAELEFERLKN